MIQNPNYYMPQYQQPMQYPQNNPYLERINNLQQYQQTLQPQQPVQFPTLNGRIVDNFDSINANDVPMQGQAVFIKNDGSEIQIRAWGKMGNIEKTSYKPILDAENEKAENLTSEIEKSQNEAFNALTEDIMKRFDDLESRLDELKKPATTKTTSRTKKESDAE